ncbi:hypothetical protein [Schlesneria paludicola]|uniref:hypothetical protein n=1 Tax=Schlesneria paludicola TaxID=360056 RepID=UPI00029AB97D|nr:hypothetical protein [Schlesneria paludicola]
MRRLSLVFGSLSLGAKLQTLAVALILAWYAWFDYRLGRWPVTVGIILFSVLVGWLLRPLMRAYPQRTSQVWRILSIAFVLTYMLAQGQWWWRLLIRHYLCEYFWWQVFSCGYWFISDLRLDQERDGAARGRESSSADDAWRHDPFNEQS